MSIHIQIDDRPLQVDRGITILQAARQNQIDIPTLCDFPGLPSHGSCRMCIVEIQGRPTTPTSCTTPVEEGMVIYTHSPKVLSLRRELLQMLLSEHPSGCLFCPENAHCSECMVTVRKAAITTGCGSCPKDDQCALQVLAERYEVEKPGYPIRYRMLPVEKNDPFFDRDYNLCVLCGRCIRVCDYTHFTNILAYTKRGTHAVVGTAFDRSHIEANCTFCGSCVELCPTGALSEKTRKWDGKPERETASTCPLCSIGCQINVLSKRERVIGSLPNHGAGTEALCVKGRFGITELVNHPTRLKRPQKREEHTWIETGWEEAVHKAAEKLAACPPERFEMQISASCTNEDLYVAAKFTREVMKSSHIRTTAQASYGAALAPLARLLQKSQPLESLQAASTILCLGIEDNYAQAVIEVQLHRAQQRGAKIIAISVARLPWSGHMDEWLEMEPGQEAILLRDLAGQVDPAGPQEVGHRLARERAAHLLRQASAPVIVLGPSLLTNLDALQSVEALVQNLSAQVIVLPEHGNLTGALQLGLMAGEPAPEGQVPEVLYLIGEMVPTYASDRPFVLYQNLYPPTGNTGVDLMLAAAAFTETEGSYLDAAGRARVFRPVVRPAGEALPNWAILSRIAQAMGVPGFAYASVEDIRAEIPGLREALDTNRPITCSAQDSLLSQSLLDQAPSDALGAHIYMGYPLAHWVKGLRSLYPEETAVKVVC